MRWYSLCFLYLWSSIGAAQYPTKVSLPSSVSTGSLVIKVKDLDKLKEVTVGSISGMSFPLVIHKKAKVWTLTLMGFAENNLPAGTHQVVVNVVDKKKKRTTKTLSFQYNPPATIESDFSVGAQGWTALQDAVFPTAFSPVTTAPNAIQVADLQDTAILYFAAPSSFLGNKMDYYGHTLSYKVRSFEPGVRFNAIDVILKGANGVTLELKHFDAPGPDWTSFQVLLKEGAWVKHGIAAKYPTKTSIPNSLATFEDLAGVLSNLQALYIRGDFRKGGGDSSQLSDVRISLDSSTNLDPAPVLKLPLEENMGLSWMVEGAHGNLMLVESGTAIQAESKTGGYGDLNYWVTPSPNSTAWPRNLEEYLGGKLTFEIKMTPFYAALASSSIDVVLANGAEAFTFKGDFVPLSDWNLITVPLSPEHWLNPDGESASEEEFLTLLSSIHQLKIRGEYSITVAHTNFLRNVSFHSAPRGIETVQLQRLSSTFLSGNDGWKIIRYGVRTSYPDSSSVWVPIAEDSHPPTLNGALRMLAETTSSHSYFVAPNKFRGDRSAYYGGTFSFKVRTNLLQAGFYLPGLVLKGNGLTLHLDIPESYYPNTMGSLYTVALKEGGTLGWWKKYVSNPAAKGLGRATDPNATKEDILTVLSGLESIELRAEYRESVNVSDLVEFHLSPPGAPLATPSSSTFMPWGYYTQPW